MDTFAGTVQSVGCNGPMTIDFVERASVIDAQREWEWVNQQTNHTFLLIASAEACGNSTDREPFKVSNATFDPDNLRAVLDAQEVSWVDAIDDYEFSVDTYRQPNTTLVQRGEDVTAKPSWDISHKQTIKLFHAAKGAWSMDATCDFTSSGKLDLSIKASAHLTRAPTLIFTAHPRGVALSAVLHAALHGKLRDGFSKDFGHIIEIAIPDAAVSVASRAKLGFFFEIEASGAFSGLDASANASMGAKMSIDNAAVMSYDSDNSRNNHFSGWTPKFPSIPLTCSGALSGDLGIGIGPTPWLGSSTVPSAGASFPCWRRSRSSPPPSPIRGRTPRKKRRGRSFCTAARPWRFAHAMHGAMSGDERCTRVGCGRHVKGLGLMESYYLLHDFRCSSPERFSELDSLLIAVHPVARSLLGHLLTALLLSSFFVLKPQEARWTSIVIRRSPFRAVLSRSQPVSTTVLRMHCSAGQRVGKADSAKFESITLDTVQGRMRFFVDIDTNLRFIVIARLLRKLHRVRERCTHASTLFNGMNRRAAVPLARQRRLKCSPVLQRSRRRAHTAAALLGPTPRCHSWDEHSVRDRRTVGNVAVAEALCALRHREVSEERKEWK